MPEVLIDNVHKSFGAVEVLKGVSLSVNRGEVFALGLEDSFFKEVEQRLLPI